MTDFIGRTRSRLDFEELISLISESENGPIHPSDVVFFYKGKNIGKFNPYKKAFSLLSRQHSVNNSKSYFFSRKEKNGKIITTEITPNDIKYITVSDINSKIKENFNTRKRKRSNMSDRSNMSERGGTTKKRKHRNHSKTKKSNK